MVNLEHKLTVDDLIVEYMMYKVNNGNEPSFSTGEFINFLLFFETKMPVFDVLYDGEELFKRFMERKSAHDWSVTKNYSTGEMEFRPHMDMVYSLDKSTYLLKANYRLSDFDKSIINTYFMDRGMSRFEHFKGQTYEIRNIIGEWLKDYPKREIDEDKEVDENYLLMGKYLSAQIIENIWKAYVEEYVKKGQWPRQCRDIEKYLLEMDLAQIIELKSIKEQLFNMYVVIAKRLAVMISEDNNLMISCASNGYLAASNYKLLIKGYEDLFKIAFGQGKSRFEIDMEKLSFTESHEIDRVYDWDEDPEVKTTVSSINNPKVKNLVMNLDKNIK